MCLICSHETHEAGRCKQCNCGESEVVHARPGGNSQVFPEHTFDDSLAQIYHTTATATIHGERFYHCQK